ncbi:hypothetical protein JCM6882_003234 [Rhodosporidiobolus microsporus]
MIHSGDGFSENPFLAAGATRERDERTTLLDDGVVGKGGETERFCADRFTVTTNPPLSSAGTVLHPNDLLMLDIATDGVAPSCKFKARMVGESETAGVETHRFLATHAGSFLPSAHTPTPSLVWELRLPAFPTCTCHTTRNTPLPSTSSGSVEGKEWRIKYYVEVLLYEQGGGKGKGKGKGKALPTTETIYLIPFTFEIKSEIFRWSAGRQIVDHVVTDLELESSNPEDLSVKSIELRHELLTCPSPSDCPRINLSYRLLVSFGVRHYPSLSRFLDYLSSATPTLSLFLEHCTVLEEYDPIRPLDPVKLAQTNVVFIRERHDDADEGGRTVENKEGKVKCEMAMVGKRGEKKLERAEEVLLEFEGSFEVLGLKKLRKSARDPKANEKDLEKFAKVETCKVRTRYDLQAVVSITGRKPLVITSQDVRIDLPPAESSTSGPSFTALPQLSGLSVAVDAERYPALAALYGGTRLSPSLSGSGGAAAGGSGSGAVAGPSRQRAEQGDDQLPMYEPPSASDPPPPRDEKRSAGPPPPSSAPSAATDAAPPSYPGPTPSATSTRDRLPLASMFSSTSSVVVLPPPPPPPPQPSPPPPPPPPAPAAPEAPPTWEETVRDDMIDDWVAASAVLGEDAPPQ